MVKRAQRNYTLCEVQGAPKVQRKRARSRTWHVSPEGFRELRHSCFLSQVKCAEFLGVSLRAVKHWDSGRNRVPWAVVRLLRITRLGDLGAIQPAWAGWTLNRNGLFPEDGRRFDLESMRLWWVTQNQAACFRRAYDEGRILGGVGRSPALTLQPEVVHAQVVTEALPPPSPEAALLMTALVHLVNEARRLLPPVQPQAPPAAAAVPVAQKHLAGIGCDDGAGNPQPVIPMTNRGSNFLNRYQGDTTLPPECYHPPFTEDL